MSNSGKLDFDPDYRAPDASLVLISSDGTKFRVYANIMSMASEIFKDMLTKATDTGEPIQLQETSSIIKALLDMIYPDGLFFDMDGRDFEFVWTLLLAANKYEMHKIMKEFRIRLLSDTYFVNNPLESYTIAAQFGWKTELSATVLGATETLNATKSWRMLARIDSIHILQLLGLIELRKLKLLSAITQELYYGPNRHDIWDSRFKLRSAANEYIDSEFLSARATFLSFVELELQKSPSGKTLRGPFWDRPEVKWLFSLNGLYNAKIVMESALDHLPCSPEDVPSIF